MNKFTGTTWRKCSSGEKLWLWHQDFLDGIHEIGNSSNWISLVFYLGVAFFCRLFLFLSSIYLNFFQGIEVCINPTIPVGLAKRKMIRRGWGLVLLDLKNHKKHRVVFLLGLMLEHFLKPHWISGFSTFPKAHWDTRPGPLINWITIYVFFISFENQSWWRQNAPNSFSSDPNTSSKMFSMQTAQLKCVRLNNSI